LLGAGIVQGQETASPYENNETSIRATSKSDNAINQGMQLSQLSSAGLFTGSTSINVPLYEYKKNNIDLSLGLVTNTKGVKLAETSGSFGLHWNLSGGGYIIKVVNDMEDDQLKTAPINTTWGGFTVLAGKLRIGAAPQSNNTYIDKEYDEYQVSVGGYSFTFYMGENGYVFVAPRHDVKIRKENDNFIITDIYGNNYYFRYEEEQQIKKFLFRHNIPGTPAVYLDNKNRIWVLAKVEFPNREQVSFSYQKYVSSFYGYTHYQEKLNGATLYNGLQTDKVASGERQLPLLKEAVYPNHDSVVFEYRVFPRCDLGMTPLLDKVSVYNSNNTSGRLRNYYQMHYSYAGKGYLMTNTHCDFYDALIYDEEDILQMQGTIAFMEGQAAYRVLLDSINLHSGISGGGNLPYYRFEYNDVAAGLPSRAVTATDYWGYYNGIEGSLPDDYVAGVNKKSFAPNLDYMKRLSLKSVTNQLGLKVTYEYDLHVVNQDMDMSYGNADPSFAARLDANRVIGRNVGEGLRVKAIRIWDPTMPGNNELRKEFTYEGGMTFLLGGTWHRPLRPLYEVNNNNGWVFEDTIVSNMRQSPYHMVQGSAQGYNKITESVYNAGGEYLSGKESYFSNVVTKRPYGNIYDNYYTRNGDRHYFELPYTQKSYLLDYKIGLLLKELNYDNLGYVTDQKELRYKFIENTFSPPSYTVNKHLLYPDITNSGELADPVMGQVLEDNYGIISGKAVVDSVLEQKYLSGGRSAKDITVYTYDADGNLLAERTYLDRDNYYYWKKYYYPRNFLTAANTEVQNIAQELVDRNILNDVGVVVTKRTLNPPLDFPYLVTDASFYTYGFNGQGDIYAITNSRLMKGNRSWSTVMTTDPEKNNAELLLRSAQDVNGYMTGPKVTKTDDYLRPLELRHRGINKYSTLRYNTHYKTEIASCNTRFDDFGFLSFERGASDDRVVYDENKLTGTAQVLDRFDRAQSGVWMLQMDNGDKIRMNGLSGNKRYVVSCWITNVGPSAPQALKVMTEGGAVELQLSRNHKWSRWYYYQAEVTLAAGEKMLELVHDGNERVWVDNVVIAPAGATYVIKSFNNRGLTDMEGTLNGKQVRYEYDAFDRLKVTRDENGNIRETFNYHISR